MIEIDFTGSCSRSSNDTISIIECRDSDQHIQYTSNDNSDIVEVKNDHGRTQTQIFEQFSILKFNLNTSLNYCSSCNEVHAEKQKQAEKVKPDQSLSLLERINNAGSFAGLFRTSVSSSSLKNRDKCLKNRIASLKETLINFQVKANNYEAVIKRKCDLMRHKLDNSININLLNEIADNQDKLLKDLADYQQKCLKHVDKDGKFWKELESLLNANKLDCDTIQFYLDSENGDQSNEPINALIENFRHLLDLKQKEFESYLLMGKRASFHVNPEFKINDNLIGFLNYVDTSSNIKFDESNLNKNEELYEHLEMFKSKKSIDCLASVQFGDKIKKKDFQLVNVFSLDQSDRLLLSNRYAISTQPNDVHCDLYLYDIDGIVLKQLKIKNQLVRCIHTNSRHVLLTLENDQIESNKYFELNLYDSNLDLLKSIKVESTQTEGYLYPISIYMNEDDKYFVFKNTLPFVNVYDSDLNLLTMFGQDINLGFKYFIHRNPKSLFVMSNVLYTTQQTSKGTSLYTVDLSTGLSLKHFEVDFNFSNFYVLSQTRVKNEILFICDSTKKLVLFNLIAKKSIFEIYLENSFGNDSDLISSYCVTRKGFLATIYPNIEKIAIY